MTSVVGNRQCSMLVRTKTKTQLFDSLYKICLGMMISRTSHVIHVIYVVKEHPQENMHKWKMSQLFTTPFTKKEETSRARHLTQWSMFIIYFLFQFLHCHSFQINCTSCYKRVYWINSK